ncbi:MAG: hypothetical protein RIR00_1076 [Pseudomonadota bacterium]|jgi:two-component system sensor histidine kinase FlrB
MNAVSSPGSPPASLPESPILAAAAPAPLPAQAADLQKAFDLFNQVSAELTQSYAALQQRASSLTEELALANGELRRQYEEKQALSERLSLLLDALPGGVLVLNGQGRVTAANPAARAMFGDNVLDGHWGDVVRASLEPAMTPGEWLLGARRLSVAESALDSAGGKILLVHDITATYQMQAEMERHQRLVAMGEMAASLAHQLRTPLATALLYTANLGQPELQESARLRFAGKATAQLQRLERLIQDVLLFARGQSMGRDEIPVGEWLHEVAQTVEPLAQERGICFQFHPDCPAAVLVGSRKALYGALINLLENALQVSETGTTVSLTAWRDGELLRIRVRDQGPGMSPEVQARIFEPFFTTRAHGTGLGLPIALGVARAHGGEISLHSVPGEGSEFVMSLPVAADGWGEDKS